MWKMHFMSQKEWCLEYFDLPDSPLKITDVYTYITNTFRLNNTTNLVIF